MTVMQAAARIDRSVRCAGDSLAFAQWVSCLTRAQSRSQAAVIFASRHPRSLHKQTVEKAAVSAGDTSSWSDIAVPPQFANALIEYIRPISVLQQLVPLFRRVPFNVKVPRATSGASAEWVGEGVAVPASPLAFESVTFGHSKIAGYCAFTKELAALSSPEAGGLIRDDLAGAVAQFSDDSFLNPERAAVAGVSPASITNSGTEITTTGSSASAIETDLASMIAAIDTNKAALRFVLHSTTALYLAKLRTASTDIRAFPDLGYSGGSIWGVPALVSSSVPEIEGSPAQHPIILLDASEVLLAGGNDMEIETSEQATVELATAPTSPPDASVVMTSLWQADLIAAKILRTVNWAPRSAGMCSWMSVDY